VDLGLRRKVALITGGTRGLGRATALRLAAEGCDVAICARSADALDRAVAELGSSAVRAHGVVADVTVPGQLERFVDASAAVLGVCVVCVLGGVDLVVANVGGSSGTGLLEATLDDWVRTFELNLFHAVRATRAAVPHMRLRGGGSVVFIASISASKPAPRAQYGAAKASEIFVAGALAWELAPDRIRVNAISPGSIMFAGGGWDASSPRTQSALPSSNAASSHPADWVDRKKWPMSWLSSCPRGPLGSMEPASPWTARKDGPLHSDTARRAAVAAGPSLPTM
jgi:3-oxoacyl-[acyl-carrier protein] reductase